MNGHFLCEGSAELELPVSFGEMEESMQKVLLIGELGDIVRSLNECLEDDFRVQICPAQLEDVQGVAKITKPDLIIACQIGIEKVDGEIFNWIQENCESTPVIVVTTREGWGQCKSYCETEQFDKVFRPVGKEDLLEKCYQRLGMKSVNVMDEDEEMEALFVKKKILIVDDNPVLLRNMKKMLEGEYVIYVATSGEIGWKMIFSKQPNLVLLDYEMPEMNGRELFEMMSEDEFAKEIPVIFLTYIDDRSQIYEVLRSDPAGYILKPPDKEKLFAEIRNVLA